MPDPLSASPLLPPCPAAASHTRARIRTRLGEYVFWDYLLVRSSEAQCGMDRIAEHGRTGHRLYEQWKSEVRRTPGPHGPPRRSTAAEAKAPASADKSAARRREAGGASDGSESSDADVDGRGGEAVTPAEERLDCTKTEARATVRTDRDLRAQGERGTFLKV